MHKSTSSPCSPERVELVPNVLSLVRMWPPMVKGLARTNCPIFKLNIDLHDSCPIFSLSILWFHCGNFFSTQYVTASAYFSMFQLLLLLSKSYIK